MQYESTSTLAYLWPPASACRCHLTSMEGHSMSSVLIFAAGWLYANFIEYAWHRWVLHSGHHQVHDAHHRAFFTGEYEARNLLNRWAILAAALHVFAACFISLKLGLV